MDKREEKRKRKEKLDMINRSTERRPMPRPAVSRISLNTIATGRRLTCAGAWHKEGTVMMVGGTFMSIGAIITGIIIMGIPTVIFSLSSSMNCGMTGGC